MTESQAPGHANDPVVRPFRGSPVCVEMAERVMVMCGAVEVWKSRDAWKEAEDAGPDDPAPLPDAEGLCLIAVRLSSDGMTSEYGEPLVVVEREDLSWSLAFHACAMEDGKLAFVYTHEGQALLKIVQVDLGSLSISTVQNLVVLDHQEYPEWSGEMEWGDIPTFAPSLSAQMGVCHVGAGTLVVGLKADAFLPSSRFPVHPDYPPQTNTEWAPTMVPVWPSGSEWEVGPYQIAYVPPSSISSGAFFDDIHVVDNKTICWVFAGEGYAGIAVVAKVDRSNKVLTIGPRNKFCWGVEDWFLTHPGDEEPHDIPPGLYVAQREGIDVSFDQGSSCLVRGGILAVGSDADNEGILGFPHQGVAAMRLLKVRGFDVVKADVRPIGERARYRCAPLAGGRAVVSRDMAPNMGNPYASAMLGWTDGIGGYAEIVDVTDDQLKILYGLGQGMSCLEGDGPGPL